MVFYAQHIAFFIALIVLQTSMVSESHSNVVNKPRDKVNSSTTVQFKSTPIPSVKTQEPQYLNGNEQQTKPGEFKDFIDNNLKNVVIGLVCVVGFILLILVCCCVCCAATVCNRTTKQCDLKELQTGKQDYHPSKSLNKNDYQISANAHVSLSDIPWKS